MENEPIGLRFSQAYLRREKTLADSERARRRIYRLFDGLHASDDDTATLRIIESQTGAEVPSGFYGPLWSDFFMRAEIRDVLDTCTIVFRILARRNRAETWRENLAVIFSEEQLHYRLDEEGGVHLAIDAEFERNLVSTIDGLGGTPFSAAREFVEASAKALDTDPPKLREAMRSTFDAVENVFKIAVDQKAPRLGASELERLLGAKIDEKYMGVERDFARRMLGSFKDWANAGHSYRHASGQQESAPPSFDSAVLFVSCGLAYLRWLIQLSPPTKDKTGVDPREVVARARDDTNGAKPAARRRDDGGRR